ncbi:MAG: ABC transporter ATP-binding protein [Alphaproteobacteria bacterium]|nr:ABC transporter ATP-binding protein [Alphaproteobacteria bacterium]
MILLEDVSKVFQRHLVLDKVSLSIGQGERIALVGSNGAGKTTLIRCLLGEYTHEGKIDIGGGCPRLDRYGVLSRIGFVPQIPPPLKMPVAELVSFAASLCGTSSRRIVDIVKELGLDFARVKRLPFVKLSGGMKQKLLIGIAFGRDADILIMDEPAANLDPEARRIFFRQLAERKERSVMLITSHRLDEVASLVNRVIEMDQGRVVLDDKVADDVDMTSLWHCDVCLRRVEPAFSRVMTEWRFQSQDQGLVWKGEVSGPDRLRFLSVLTRYAGLIASLRMQENKEDDSCAPPS